MKANIHLIYRPDYKDSLHKSIAAISLGQLIVRSLTEDTELQSYLIGHITTSFLDPHQPKSLIMLREI